MERLQRRIEAAQIALTAAEGELGQLRNENRATWMREAQSKFNRAREGYEAHIKP